ncbi:MAG: ParA family protein [Magnetococcus sp. DMHC-6]
MKIFAVYNLKGGVGKTTTSVNLSYLSAMEGARTLIWDLDPQGGTSYYLCVKPKIKGGTRELLQSKPPLDSLLRMTGYPNLDMLPSDISYRNMDSILQESHQKPGSVLGQFLKPLANKYDHIFLDCPPGLSLVTENVFQLADVLIIPLIPSPLSLRAYNRLVQFLVKQRSKKLVVLPFFNLVNMNKPIHQVVIKNVIEKHRIFLKQSLPDSNIIELMGIKRSPIFTYAKQSEEAKALQALWQEILSRSE